MQTSLFEKNGMTILLYSPVKEKHMLEQGFYRAEIDGLLKDPRIKCVKTTNNLLDVMKGHHDAVITYFYSYSAFAAAISFARRKPVIATGGGEQVFRSMAPNGFVYIVRLALFFFTLLFAKRIFATSSSDLVQMKRIAPFRSSAIVLSFHGTPLADHINFDAITKFRRDFTFVTICGMDTYENVKRKGLFKAIQIIAKLRDLGYSAELTIIGRKTCADIVLKEARRLNCESSIMLTGYISEEDKFSILRGSKYYLQLSDYEGFGIGALEALASGCIVMHSGKGGLRDSISNFGIVVSDADLNEFDFSTIDIDLSIRLDELVDHLKLFSEIKRAKTLVDGILND